MVADGCPLVSIGLPVHNGERYLTEALDSLLHQTFQDFEIIISDNCSSDESEVISKEYSDRDPRIIYVRQQRNLGAIGNFNFVFSKARGKYFKWAAHDDVCEPTFVESCVEVLEANPNVVWCHCESDQIDEYGESWLRRISPQKSHSVERINGNLRWAGHPRKDHDSTDPCKRFAGVILGTNWAVDSYALIRSDALRKTRMLLPIYGAEKILLGELALQGPYYHLPDRLFAQRIHAEASGNLRSSRFQAAFAVGKNARRFLPMRFAILWGHIGAVMHADLIWSQRLKCLVVVGKYLLQMGKWKRIFQAALFGRGVGGEGYREMQRQTTVASDNS